MDYTTRLKLRFFVSEMMTKDQNDNKFKNIKIKMKL